MLTASVQEVGWLSAGNAQAAQRGMELDMGAAAKASAEAWAVTGVTAVTNKERWGGKGADPILSHPREGQAAVPEAVGGGGGGGGVAFAHTGGHGGGNVRGVEVLEGEREGGAEEGGIGAAGMEGNDEYVLIDVSGLIFRSFFAMGALTGGSGGVATNAVYGVCRTLQELHSKHFPGRRMIAVFDHPDDSFRSALLPEYKAQRPPVPDDLKVQFAMVKDAVKAFNMPAVEVSGYEADDLIATLTRKIVGDLACRCVVVTSDKDLFQLVGERVRIWDPYKRVFLGREEVIEKFGVPPEKVVDVQALAGDPSDNVPGVPGIGYKTAAKLIQEFGDLDTLLARAAEIPQKKRRESLLQHADSARLCRKLVLLADDAPLPDTLDLTAYKQPVRADIEKYLASMGFKSLLTQMNSSSSSASTAAGTPSAAPSVRKPAVSEGAARQHPQELNIAQRLMREEAAEGATTELREVEGQYELVTEMDMIATIVEEARQQPVVAIDVISTSQAGQSASLMGIALATSRAKAFYFPVGHEQSATFQDAFSSLDEQELVQALKPLLQDAGVLKVGYNMKLTMSLLQRIDGEAVLSSFDDIMLMSSCIDAGRRDHSLLEMARIHLGLAPPSLARLAAEAVLGGVMTSKGKVATKRLELLPPAVIFQHAAGLADLSLRLHALLRPLLAVEGVSSSYHLMEQPLVEVLARMEATGVAVDRDLLEKLSVQYADKIKELEAQIFGLAGREFALSSPKQLAGVLFQELRLPAPKKNPKGGEYSTGAEVLEDLARGGHEIARLVGEWRALTKLKSTYSDPLVTHINARTGRIHTSYQMAATATGRLSSVDPNLQNIPTAGEGHALREAFVASRGHVLVSADYSQIELRLLAHMAQVPALQEAFANNVDVHRLTANQVFGVPHDQVTDELRRRAKAINFGIIYGQSSYGLAKGLDISVKDAKEYIDTYFAQYPGIAAYMEATKASARQRGYVETAFGRRCHIPNIRSGGAAAGYAGRQAINAPIQGTAADIIKFAMLRIAPKLSEAGLQVFSQPHAPG
jgi:DNA polymerase I